GGVCGAAAGLGVAARLQRLRGRRLLSGRRRNGAGGCGAVPAHPRPRPARLRGGAGGRDEWDAVRLLAGRDGVAPRGDALRPAAGRAPMLLFETRGLCKYYRAGSRHEVRAVDDVTLGVAAGSLTVLT